VTCIWSKTTAKHWSLSPKDTHLTQGITILRLLSLL